MDNCLTSTQKLISLLGIDYTQAYLEDSILSHPDYPSLLAIADTLGKYQIENLALKISIDKLHEAPLPCIVQISDRNNVEFCVLDAMSEIEVSYYVDKGNLVKSSLEKFSGQWTGICLLAEKTRDSKEPEIEKTLVSKRVSDVIKVAVLSLLMVWGIINFTYSEVIKDTTFSIYVVLYTLLKITGLILGTLLLWFEIDQSNPTLQKYCSGGKKINCDSVLNSKYAKLFGEKLSLSLLGYSYFFGSLTYLLLNTITFSSLTLLAYFSLVSIPVVLFSTYYQAFVLKQWCKFCVMVQAVLVSEIIVVILGGFYKGNIAPETLLLFFAFLLIPVAAWGLIRPLLEKERETNLYKRGLKRIKNNRDVFEGLLAKSRKITKDTKGLGIIIGSETAKFQVINVCNPYCFHCARTYPILDDLVKEGKIRLQIMFTASTVENDLTSKPVKHFLAIDALGDISKAKKAMGEWYNAEHKDYEAFAKNYPMNGELERQNDKIKGMRVWCDAQMITRTPSIFINGHELPYEYGVEDLRDIIR